VVEVADRNKNPDDLIYTVSAPALLCCHHFVGLRVCPEYVIDNIY
jgi:hypothetical protein